MVCLTVLEHELVNRCHYTAATPTGATTEEAIELIIELYNTKYEAVLRNAQTAEIYDSTVFVATTDGVCDPYTFEIVQQEVRILEAEPGEALAAFLEPWVVKK